MNLPFPAIVSQLDEASTVLDRQLRQLIGYFDTLSQRLMVKRSPELVPDLEVSQLEIRAVVMLGGKESTIMSDLAAKGLAERARGNGNRRIVRVALTAKGRLAKMTQHSRATDEDREPASLSRGR